MNKNESIIRQTLEKIFNLLTVDKHDFIDLYGYKTTEIKVGNYSRTVGIGFYEPASVIQISFIEDTKNDHLRFMPFMNISYKRGLEDSVTWGIRFLEIEMYEEVGLIKNISASIMVAYRIIQMIEIEEKSLMSKA